MQRRATAVGGTRCAGAAWRRRAATTLIAAIAACGAPNRPTPIAAGSYQAQQTVTASDCPFDGAAVATYTVAVTGGRYTIAAAGTGAPVDAIWTGRGHDDPPRVELTLDQEFALGGCTIRSVGTMTMYAAATTIFGHNQVTMTFCDEGAPCTSGRRLVATPVTAP